MRESFRVVWADHSSYQPFGFGHRRSENAYPLFSLATFKWVYLFGDLRRFAPWRESMPPDTIINAFPQNTGNNPKAAPIDPNKSGPTTRAR